MAEERQRIKNLLGKLNDEDRNRFVSLLAKAGYAVRIRKRKGRRQRSDNVFYRVLGGKG